jgi:cyclopropane fatty-acyl-phospholipid synthase-like methyltransferase
MAASERGDSAPGPVRSRPPHDFDAMYQETPPWDIGRPQPAFRRLAEAGLVTGAVLDVGCGTGEHALMAAAAGCDAVGVDTAPSAIAIAERKARDRGLPARFVVLNALELDKLDQRFDTVLDCGLFHVFDDADRAPYARSLASALTAGGHYFLLCFSDRQPGDTGPRRVSRDEIRATFAEGWRIDSIEPTTIDITISADGARAWLASMTRT